MGTAATALRPIWGMRQCGSGLMGGHPAQHTTAFPLMSQFFFKASGYLFKLILMFVLLGFKVTGRNPDLTAVQSRNVTHANSTARNLLPEQISQPHLR